MRWDPSETERFPPAGDSQELHVVEQTYNRFLSFLTAEVVVLPPPPTSNVLTTFLFIHFTF